jgi:hypothetical protein
MSWTILTLLAEWPLNPLPWSASQRCEIPAAGCLSKRTSVDGRATIEFVLVVNSSEAAAWRDGFMDGSHIDHSQARSHPNSPAQMLLETGLPKGRSERISLIRDPPADGGGSLIRIQSRNRADARVIAGFSNLLCQ